MLCKVHTETSPFRILLCKVHTETSSFRILLCKVHTKTSPFRILLCKVHTETSSFRILHCKVHTETSSFRLLQCEVHTEILLAVHCKIRNGGGFDCKIRQGEISVCTLFSICKEFRQRYTQYADYARGKREKNTELKKHIPMMQHWPVVKRV